MINDGKKYCLNLEKMTDKEKTSLAEEFAEGSVALKNLLLTFWNQNLETSACCKGHNKTRNAKRFYLRPYISFPIDKLSNEELEWFLKKLVKLRTICLKTL